MPINLTDLFPDLYTADPEPYVDPDDEEQRQYNPLSEDYYVNELLNRYEFPDVDLFRPAETEVSWPPSIVSGRTGYDPDEGWAGVPENYEVPTSPLQPFVEKFSAAQRDYDQAEAEYKRVVNAAAAYDPTVTTADLKLAEKDLATAKQVRDKTRSDYVKAQDLEAKGELKKVPPAPRGTVPRGYKRQFNQETWEWEDVPLGIGSGGGGGGGGGSGRAEAMLGLAFDKFSYQQEKDAAARALQEQRYMEQQALNERKQQALEAYRLQQEERKIAQEERSYKGQLAQMAWQMAKARMDDDARMQQLQAQLAMQIGEQLQSAYFKALPNQAIPGQTHFLGFEPGGIASRIARLSGRTYNPESYRAPINDFNPGQFTGWAAKAMGL